MEANTFVQRATWLLVALATVALQAALWNGLVEPWFSIARLLVVVLIVVAGCWWLKDSPPRQLISALEATFLLALFLLPLVVEPLSRSLLGQGSPWEIVMVTSLRNATLGLAVLPHVACQRLASVGSFFVVLFAFLLQFDWLTALLAASYLIVGMWWLIGVYWEKLQGKMPTTTRRALPKRASLLAVVTVFGLAALASVLVGPGEKLRSLSGFMPSSGGDQRAGSYAWSGIGDGDQLVAAKYDAMSFGPVESELFLDSDMPSLYDMFDETYGGPIKQSKTERAVSLAPQDRLQQNQQAAVSNNSSREFSAIREKLRQRRKKLEDRESNALFYVVGRTPLHLALETYDTFDGMSWTKSNTQRFTSHLRVDTIHDEPWVRLRSPYPQLFAQGYESHALKIINLDTRCIPSPPHLSRVHIDKVDRADFFAWNDEGVLEMPGRERIPRFTVIHLRSLRTKQDAVHELGDFTRGLPAVDTPVAAGKVPTSSQERIAKELTPYRAVNPVDDGRMHELLQDWTGDIPRGWAQVEAIIDHLRGEYVHDPAANAPEDCVDVVEHFLIAGRGPDYMFATTAAMMLRELGYPTRLVAGFYVRPNRYDRRARQTPALGEDVHVWAEVCIDGRHWMPIEPTPGYEAPPEAQSWTQWAASACWAVLTWLRANLLLVALAAVAIVLALALRRLLLDVAASLAWKLLGRGSPENRVLWTIWLLERRAHLAGNPRPQCTTLAQWFARLSQPLPAPAQTTARSFVLAAERVLYGARRPGEEVGPCCESAASHFNRRLFQDPSSGKR